ncbi:MAG: hypothetical protein AAEC03_00035 [Synechococcus sp.]
MIRRFGVRSRLLAAAAAVWAGMVPVQAGFTPEQLEGFELSHMRGVVTAVLPKQKVIEVLGPEGNKEIITVGIDMAPLKLKSGDGVDVSVLDGLVVDLQRSTSKELSFEREDIYMPADMGPLKKGMRVALASGTARVVKASQRDRSISLIGPLGGIHNLDVLPVPGEDLFPQLKAGDVVAFRLIQPVAVAIDRDDSLTVKNRSVAAQPLQAPVVNSNASLKAELLSAFELTQVQGTLIRMLQDGTVLELRSPYGHTMLITMSGGLNTAALKPGDQLIVDLLDGLVVDLRKSSAQQLNVNRKDVILSDDFGRIRRGARVAMATGTAEVVKIAEEDQEISLRGPFGGVHNLDVRDGISGDPFSDLKLGDFVDFRMIQPIAIAIRRLP